MTVTSSTNRADFVGNGSATIFPFTFRIFDETDLEVREGPPGSTVVKVLNTDYTVTINLDGTGDVVFLTAPVSLNQIVIRRILPLTQLVDFPVAGKFPASANEEAEDRGVMIDQQKAEEDSRRITLSPDSLLTGVELPSPGAGLFFRWNQAGTALELIAVTASDTSDVIVARGDIIRGGALNVAERLPKAALGALLKTGALDVDYLLAGTDGQVLTVVGGDLVWVDVSAVGVVVPGMMTPFGGTAAPAGYLLCDGTAVSRTTFAALFAVTGTAFGIGDGSTTFNLPDLRGRIPLGKDDMGGVSADRVTDAAADVLGGTLGLEALALTLAQMPAHAHTVPFVSTSCQRVGGCETPGVNNSTITGGPTATTVVGGSDLVSRLQPSQTFNYIIRT